MKFLKLISILGGLSAAATLAQAQDYAPSVLTNVIFNGTIASGTGGAATAGHISSLLGNDSVDYTLESDGSLSDPVPFTYTKGSASHATLAESAVGALPAVSVALTFTSSTAGNFTATYGGGSTQTGAFSLVPVGAVSPLVNVSAQTTLGVGSSAITGFVLAGNSPRKVLIRAVGSTLGQYGVASPLPNPALTVWHGSQSIASNDDWDAGTNVDATLPAVFNQVGAFHLPAGSKDAAIVLTLDPGVYTAQIGSSVSGDSGRVLLEVYLVP